jgi:ATP-dependent Clp protease ATP-binding subunit ClpA
VIARVVEKFILELETQLDNKNVFIQISEKAAMWIGKEGYDENMGARPLSRLIQEKIKKPIAEQILYGKLSKGGNIKVDIKNNELSFEYLPLKKSSKKNKQKVK